MIDIDKMDDRTYRLWFGVHRSVRYHEHRREFYERWHRWTIMLCALGSSIASGLYFLSVELMWVAVTLTVIVAASSLLDWGAQAGRSALDHAELQRRFSMLEQEFASGKTLTDSEYSRLTCARLEIERAEPSTLRLLDTVCHFEVLKALGDERDFPYFPWLRRLLLYLSSQKEYSRRLESSH